MANLLWPNEGDWPKFLEETGRAKHPHQYTPRNVAAWLLENKGYVSLLNTVLEKKDATDDDLTEERWWNNVRGRAVDMYKTREKRALDNIRAEHQRRQQAKQANQQQPPHHPQDSPESVARKVADFQR